MIIYTNLDPQTTTFLQIQQIAKIYNITLRSGVFPQDKNEKEILFWITKSNRLLSQFRAKEAIINLYYGLDTLERHKDLIK